MHFSRAHVLCKLQFRLRLGDNSVRSDKIFVNIIQFGLIPLAVILSSGLPIYKYVYLNTKPKCTHKMNGNHDQDRNHVRSATVLSAPDAPKRQDSWLLAKCVVESCLNMWQNTNSVFAARFGVTYSFIASYMYLLGKYSTQARVCMNMLRPSPVRLAIERSLCETHNE